jgi:hypothetical protein
MLHRIYWTLFYNIVTTAYVSHCREYSEINIWTLLKCVCVWGGGGGGGGLKETEW